MHVHIIMVQICSYTGPIYVAHVHFLEVLVALLKYLLSSKMETEKVNMMWILVPVEIEKVECEIPPSLYPASVKLVHQQLM